MNMKKKPTLTAPWEITAEMFLSENETLALQQHLLRREKEADAPQRPSRIVDRLIVEILLASGLRNSELCHLRVVDTIVGHGESALNVTGTSKEDRTVYVAKATSELIQQFVTDVRPQCLPDGADPADLQQPLILNERGKIYDRTALYRRVVRILTEAGLAERASVQLLRHTYGFLAYKRTGGNLLFVQKQLGHAHPMVTAVYARFVDHPASELAELVGGAKSSVPKTASNAATASQKKGVR
jgi:site-specific recombinase XerD